MTMKLRALAMAGMAAAMLADPGPVPHTGGSKSGPTINPKNTLTKKQWKKRKRRLEMARDSRKKNRI